MTAGTYSDSYFFIKGLMFTQSLFCFSYISQSAEEYHPPDVKAPTEHQPSSPREAKVQAP